MTEEEALISVIVPVYKVEKYICRCIESIIGQSYSNIEIILVDDGSPDNCGRICDRYKAEDKRISVIHKSNGGLSSARNAGMEAANGEYIAFIDGDDYIESNMMELMLKRIAADKTDMAVCNYRYVNEDGKPICSSEERCPIKDEVISGTDILYEKMTCDEYPYWVVACSKLYSRRALAGIRFPEGKLHEDAFVAHYIFFNVKSVSCCKECLYNYVQRDTSITHKAYTPQRLDGVEGALKRLAFAAENNFPPKAIDGMLNMYCGSLFTSYSKANMHDDEFKKRYKALHNAYKREFADLKRIKGGLMYKIKITAMYIAPHGVYMIRKHVK